MVKRKNKARNWFFANQPIDVSWYFRDVCFCLTGVSVAAIIHRGKRWKSYDSLTVHEPASCDHFFASQCIARTVFTQLSKTKSSLTKGKYSFSHNHGSVANDPQMKGKSSLEIHSLSTGCHDCGRKCRNQQFPGGTPLLFLIHPRSQTTKPVYVTWDSSKKNHEKIRGWI